MYVYCSLYVIVSPLIFTDIISFVSYYFVHSIIIIPHNGTDDNVYQNYLLALCFDFTKSIIIVHNPTTPYLTQHLSMGIRRQCSASMVR